MNVHGNEKQKRFDNPQGTKAILYKHYLISKLYPFVKVIFQTFEKQNKESEAQMRICGFPCNIRRK